MLRHRERGDAIQGNAMVRDCFVASLLAMTTLCPRAQGLRRFPVAPVIVWHLDVGRTLEREGVVDGIGERRHAADIRTLADTLGADPMMRRRSDGEVGLPMRRLYRGRPEEIHERTGDDVAAFVIADFLAHRDRKGLRQAAMDLSLDDHR